MLNCFCSVFCVLCGIYVCYVPTKDLPIYLSIYLSVCLYLYSYCSLATRRQSRATWQKRPSHGFGRSVSTPAACYWCPASSVVCVCTSTQWVMSSAIYRVVITSTVPALTSGCCIGIRRVRSMELFTQTNPFDISVRHSDKGLSLYST